ncbi:CDC48 family AAA ATPase [Haloarcula litorea]|uniref:CDC48 family AAA ATPase n=1 Tax=Haloarcula litorea TaxID=3032579 RepID=UPI0023E8B658|nr:CDC48 family AAA ATPase [Halomicroarcula sp. GDY20]
MELTVKPLKNREPGSGMAVVDRQVLEDSSLTSGDFVRLAGRDGSAVARVWPSDRGDAGRGYVRVDGQLRQAAGVSVDDRVTAEPASVEPAERVTLALPEQFSVRGDIGPHVREELADQAVTAGQTVALPFGGLVAGRSSRRVPVRVVETRPSGPVVVGDDTTVDLADGPTGTVDVEGGEPSEADVPGVTYEDVGGLDDELEQVREMIELPMRHPELFGTLGIEPPKGVLLHGPPGTGKTLIARAVANEIDAHFTTISGPEIMSKYYGESEEQLREVFDEAEENEPAIVFVDELDSIAPKREEVSGDVERRVVAQLLSLMDGLDERGQITVIGTTNRVDAVDPALRRPGRFDREIEIGVPDRDGREEVLRIHTRGMPVADDVDLGTYAENTHGFVGADLENLAKEGAMHALRRVRPDLDLEADEIDADVLDAIEVTDDDFREALRGIEPSAMREVFVEVPDVTWDDVGGLEEAKERLRETVQWPLEHDEAYDRVGLDPAKGVLLHGPPGTGKTLLAKAVANEAQSNFISVKGPELLNKYVGESEKGVREVFSKARENAPTVVFFDEIDAIAAERSGGGADSNVGERVVSQLLTELDGLEDLEDVVVIATTNRPDLVDDALLRPGRLDQHVHVDAPDEAARREIFAVHTRDKPLADDVDLDDLAARTDGHVGADVEAVCREAAAAALREHVEEGSDVADIEVTTAHFEQALDEVEAAVESAATREALDVGSVGAESG